MSVGDSSRHGYRAFVGVGRETTWGSKITSTCFLEFKSETMEKKQASELLPSINAGRTPTHRILKNEEVGGSIDTYLNVASDAVVSMFVQAMGGSCTSVASGTAYHHTIMQGVMTGTCQALTLQMRRGEVAADIFDYVGCRVGNWSIKAEPGGAASAKFDLIGKYGTTSSDSCTSADGITVALTEINPINWQGFTYKIGNYVSMTSVIASGTAEVITGLEITYDNGLISDDAARNLGSLQLGVLPPTESKISLKISQRYDTSTAITRGFDESATSIGIIMTNGVTIGAAAGATTYSMVLTFPKCLQTTVQPKVGSKGIMMLEYTYEVIAPSAGAAPMTMVISNGTASY